MLGFFGDMLGKGLGALRSAGGSALNFLGGGGQTGGNSWVSGTPNQRITGTFGSGMNVGTGSGYGSFGKGVSNSAKDGLGSMFKSAFPGVMTMAGSQMVGNPKPPRMPDSFNQYMNMMNQGGTPGMQQAQNYYSGVLSGQNKDAYDAAFNSLDLNYQEQLRQLNSMYRSLRPGTDPMSDSTYQRDLAQLNDQYARQRAQIGAQVQAQAAQGAAGLGQQQIAGLQQGIQAQLNTIADQWGMNYAQKEALRNQILGLGAGMVNKSLGIRQNPFYDLFGRD
jgi:hypothetical protein